MKFDRSSISYSRIVVIFVAAWMLVYPCFRNNTKILSWDVFGYYLYLPGKFIWHDASLRDFSKVKAINEKYELTPSYYQAILQGNGKYLIKYTCGVAVMETPFFLTAHYLAPLFGYEQDGYSAPYRYAMLFASNFWLIIGFIFLRRSLLKFFSEAITAITLLLLLLATNLYITALLSPGMTHLFEFGLFAVILWLTIRWHESPNVKRSAMLGLFIGLAALVRPTDIVVILIPALWGVTSFPGIFSRFRFLFVTHFKELIVTGLMIALVALPQIWYWHGITGHFLETKYGNNPGEGFAFTHPYIMKMLFSFRKGWFLYTPLMLLAVWGMAMMWKKNRKIFFPVFLFFILNLYIVSSWSCWWYAESFSSRALIDSYPVMAIAIAFFLLYIRDKGAMKRIGYFLIGIFAMLNLFQSWQYSSGILDGSRMTAAYYFRSFGKTSVSDEDRSLLLIDRSSIDAYTDADLTGYSIHTTRDEGFEVPIPLLAQRYCDTLSHSGKRSYFLDSTWVFSPAVKIAYKDLTNSDHAWVRIGFWFYPTSAMDRNQLVLVATFEHDGRDYNYSKNLPGNKMKDVKIGEWNHYTVDYLTPEVRDKQDTLAVYFWEQNKAPVFVDDLHIDAYVRPE